MTAWNVYVGCFTDDIWNYYPRSERDRAQTSPGMERLVFDDAAGGLEHRGSVGGELRSPQYLARHPHLPMIYAVEFSGQARILAYDIQPDGDLTPRSVHDTHGAMALAVGVHPGGGSAYVCHLGGGILATARLTDEGAVAEVTHVAGNAAPEVVPLSQESVFAYTGAGSKLHHLQVTPDGAFLLVADVGCDEICVYGLGENGDPKAVPVARVSFPETSSPRHIELHPEGNRIYVVTEGDARLYVLEAEAFVPTRIMDVHELVPDDHRGDSLPSEVRLHPHGHTLYVGVRRADHIAIFDVDGAGDVLPKDYRSSRGRDPRALTIAPQGGHLLVANWQSGDLSVFAIDPDGGLVPLGEPVAVPSPSSIIFGPPHP